MKKFSKIIESINSSKFYKITSEVELIIPADNEGEASYIADSTLSSTRNISNYIISSIEETSNDYMKENILTSDINLDKTLQDQIEYHWENEFMEKTPTSIEKLEFYHKLRKLGFNSDMIFKVLGDKL
jgi:hypothetical protein